MKDYDFILKFDLPENNQNPEVFVEDLYEAGCSDATIGIGQKGRIAINFIRQHHSALDAITSAIIDVKKAIPNARLIEATPDIVGITEIADIIGCSRQNMRNVAITNQSAFPKPIHEGSASLWNLSKVLQWLKAKGSYEINDELIEVSGANMQVNLARQMEDADRNVQKELRSLLA